MGQYRMKIDLRKCVGCSACALACKTGNNTQVRASGQTFNWADFINETVGTFPSAVWTSLPTMCNHCENPACVRVCPVAPDAEGRKAVYKNEDTGIVMYNNTRCVGCRACQRACPYSVLTTRRTSPEAKYSVISYNAKAAHDFWEDDAAVISWLNPVTNEVEPVTATPKQLVAAVKSTPPNKTDWVSDDEGAEIRDTRAARTVEKCNFCAHKLACGEEPYCVSVCPAKARVVLGPDDPDPAEYKVQKPGSLAKVDLVAPAAATSVGPKVLYVNDFSPRTG